MNEKTQYKLIIEMIRSLEKRVGNNKFQDDTNYDFDINDINKLEEIIQMKLKLNKLEE